MRPGKEIYVIIVAGGTGSRFGAAMPKQYCELLGKPILCHTVRRMREATGGANILTVVSPEMRDFWIELAPKNGVDPGQVVDGGKTRWESVKNAVETLGDAPDDAIVLVHDGVRPLVDDETVSRVIDSVVAGVSVVPVVPVTDSLRKIGHEGESSPVDRSEYRAVVTPQGFTLGSLRRAYKLPYDPAFTDDASVMSAAGMPSTVLVDSNTSNIKITNPGDIALAAYYLTR